MLCDPVDPEVTAGDALGGRVREAEEAVRLRVFLQDLRAAIFAMVAAVDHFLGNKPHNRCPKCGAKVR